MKVLFAQNMLHVPAYGGANKANRLLAEQLAAQGHECHLVAPLTGHLPGSTEDQASYLARHGVQRWERDRTAVTYELSGVHAHAVTSPSGLTKRIRSVASDLDPDWIVVPSDDPAGLVLASALSAGSDRAIYIAYTIQQLPCGPRAFYPRTGGVDMLGRVAGVLAISRAAQSYLSRWAGVQADLLYPPVYGPVPPAGHRPAALGSVTMINPCGYKGLAIFLGLARAFPKIPFLAVPTWGTTPEDRAALGAQSNIEIITPEDDIDVILRRTRVLLVPSLWDETFGFSCVDAMIRGIPVIASAVAGLTEAKLGVPYVLPVRQIGSYDAAADRARPVPAVPEQDLGPWAAALRRLLSDQAHWDDVAARSRSAAVAFAGSIDQRALEKYLLALAVGRDAMQIPAIASTEAHDLQTRHVDG